MLVYLISKTYLHVTKLVSGGGITSFHVPLATKALISSLIAISYYLE